MSLRDKFKKSRAIRTRANRMVAERPARAFLGISAGVMVFGASASATDWRAESLPQYDRLFEQTNGWIGAD
ncbi:MAG TPA: hypothetical protein VL970_06760, partial [Candidatus Acidoferrales bacterium]|nr:hypothetical protein [Candidatus Acidoferrales bacterium]